MSKKLEKGKHLVGETVYIVPTGSHLKNKEGIFIPSQEDILTGEPISKIKCMRIVAADKRGNSGIFDMEELDISTGEVLEGRTISMPMNGEHAYSIDAGRTTITRGWDFYDSLEDAEKALSNIGKGVKKQEVCLNDMRMAIDIEVKEELTPYQRKEIVENLVSDDIRTAGYTHYDSTIFQLELNVSLATDSMPDISSKITEIKKSIVEKIKQIAETQDVEFKKSMEKLNEKMIENDGYVIDSPEMYRYLFKNSDDILDDISFIEIKKDSGVYAFVAEDSTQRTLGYALLNDEDDFLVLSDNYQDIEKALAETNNASKITSVMGTEYDVCSENLIKSKNG